MIPSARIRFIGVLTALTFWMPAIAPSAEEDDSWAGYGSISVGGIWPSLDVSRTGQDAMYFGTEVAASVGLEMTWLRWDVAEIAYNWADSNVDGIKGSTSLLSLGTGFRVGPFRKGYRFYPYASLGFAGARMETQGTGAFTEYSNWGFEWNVGFGAEARITDRLRAGLRYRYRSASSKAVPEFSRGVVTADIDIHSLSIELVY